MFKIGGRLKEVETLKRNGVTPSPAEITQYGYDAAGEEIFFKEKLAF